MNQLKQQKYKTQIKSDFKKSTKDLQQIFLELSIYKDIDVYIHGSWADDTKTTFSDLDDLIILGDKYLHDTKIKKELKKALDKIEMKFYELDPIQHHGHWIVLGSQLENLDESYLPVSVLEGAIRIKGRKKVKAKINVEKSRIGFKRNLLSNLSAMKKLYPKYKKNRINIYEMKKLVGSVFITCPYVFQKNGGSITKKEALGRREEIFSEEACNLINKCTQIREEWERCLKGYRYETLVFLSRNIKNPSLYKKLPKYLSPRFPKNKFPILTEGEFEIFFKEVEQHYENDKK